MSTLLMILGLICLLHAIATLTLETQATIVFIMLTFNFILMIFAFSFWGVLGTIGTFVWWCGLMAEIDKRKK